MLLENTHKTVEKLYIKKMLHRWAVIVQEMKIVENSSKLLKRYW